MIGIPRLTFLKNGKCGKCNNSKLTLRSHTSRLYEQLSFTEIFSTASHTSRLSEHLSATEMFWTTSTAYMFLGE